MNLNSVIVEWSKRTGKEIPADVHFKDYATMEETAQDVGWTDYPSFVECNSIWNQMHDIWNLEQYREDMINRMSQLAFEIRASLVPEYKIVNAALRIYDMETEEYIQSIIQQFRNEFYRLKASIEEAENIEEINKICDTHCYGEIV